MFAPFWLLGMAALLGAVWHMIHLAIVHRRAQAAGHGPGLGDAGRHHLRRALIAIGAFFALGVGGLLIMVMGRLLLRA